MKELNIYEVSGEVRDAVRDELLTELIEETDNMMTWSLDNSLSEVQINRNRLIQDDIQPFIRNKYSNFLQQKEEK